MESKKEVRLGIIGIGNIGNLHLWYLLDNKVSRVKVTALCDIVPSKMDKYPDIKKFTDSAEMIRSGEVDAVIICTPHYFHTTIGIDALEQGLHVLVEKPISVHKADCQRLIAAHTNKDQVFAAMFNQRTDPKYKKVKKLIESGQLGAIQRVNWIITDWFRTESYYVNGEWRGTWGGEGGGVLMNQCPHQLDLIQWLCGMPSKMRAFCGFGAYHNIEVEDQVTAYMEYPNGATGVFITTTGEAPGTNRLEIAGDLGKIVIEGGKVAFTRNEMSASEFCRTSEESFAAPEIWNIEIPTNGNGGQHREITQNFIDAILDGTPLIAPAEEGIRSVELANSMLYSSLTSTTVDLPIDPAAFETELKKLIANSTFEKKVVEAKAVDMSKSF